LLDRGRWWLLLSLLLLLLDQASKGWISGYLSLHQSEPLMAGLNLTLMHNYGAAFSFLGNAGGWQRWLFSGIAVAVSLLLTVWLWRLQGNRRLALALALILGGALGNLWDRLLLGYVIDFIDIYYAGWHWPAFNVADSAITVGALLLLWHEMRPATTTNGETQ